MIIPNRASGCGLSWGFVGGGLGGGLGWGGASAGCFSGSSSVWVGCRSPSVAGGGALADVVGAPRRAVAAGGSRAGRGDVAGGADLRGRRSVGGRRGFCARHFCVVPPGSAR